MLKKIMLVITYICSTALSFTINTSPLRIALTKTNIARRAISSKTVNSVSRANSIKNEHKKIRLVKEQKAHDTPIHYEQENSIDTDNPDLLKIFIRSELRYCCAESALAAACFWAQSKLGIPDGALTTGSLTSLIPSFMGISMTALALRSERSWHEKRIKLLSLEKNSTTQDS